MRMARRISHACESVCPPTMRELIRYSSLWMRTRNASDATAVPMEMPRERMTMTVLEMRLPRTGMSPHTKVMSTMVVENGRRMPNSGSTTSR